MKHKKKVEVKNIITEIMNGYPYYYKCSYDDGGLTNMFVLIISFNKFHVKLDLCNILIDEINIYREEDFLADIIINAIDDLNKRVIDYFIGKAKAIIYRDGLVFPPKHRYSVTIQRSGSYRLGIYFYIDNKIVNSTNINIVDAHYSEILVIDSIKAIKNKIITSLNDDKLSNKVKTDLDDFIVETFGDFKHNMLNIFYETSSNVGDETFTLYLKDDRKIIKSVIVNVDDFLVQKFSEDFNDFISYTKKYVFISEDVNIKDTFIKLHSRLNLVEKTLEMLTSSQEIS